MNRLLVIGMSSIDTLHLKDRSVTCVGGAGMYTAMAARRCGAQVANFGPCPDPCPALLRPVEGCLMDCFGPHIDPQDVPRFEISYRRGRTEYLNLHYGAEGLLLPEMLPDDLSQYDLAHVIPVGDSVRELAFVKACRQRGVKQVSAGTFPRAVQTQPEAVRAVIDEADYFFMNQREATTVFGSLNAARTAPGKVLFVTLGSGGAHIIQGDFCTWIAAVDANDLDPTGAGDTFCGATLAYLLQNEHPIMAARRAAALAAEMIEQVGPSALLADDPPPQMAVDQRVQVNGEQVRKIAKMIAALSGALPFPFTGPEYPEVEHPRTVDYFFAATLQQFGFWSAQNSRYDRPLIATIGGIERKGSDYLWAAFTRKLQQDKDFCSPERQASLSREELREVFRADDGQEPMPALDLHLEMARSYGRDMLALNLTPRLMLQQAAAAPKPLRAFIYLLNLIGGYKEDPLPKKPGLLALILHQRPEKFLALRQDEQVPPVIDYHLMRSALRTGLVDVLDPDLAAKLRDRHLVSPEEEWAVRYPAYQAMEQLIALSGRRTGVVDWFFFNARRRCPEMSDPLCAACPVDPVCAHRKALFQPVIRTPFY